MMNFNAIAAICTLAIATSMGACLTEDEPSVSVHQSAIVGVSAASAASAASSARAASASTLSNSSLPSAIAFFFHAQRAVARASSRRTSVGAQRRRAHPPNH